MNVSYKDLWEIQFIEGDLNGKMSILTNINRSQTNFIEVNRVFFEICEEEKRKYVQVYGLYYKGQVAFIGE